MSSKRVPKKEQKLNESQFKKVVRAMARKAIKEHFVKKEAAVAKLNEAKKKKAALKEGKQTPSSQKITKDQLREMVRDSILECLEEELDNRIKAKKPAKK